MSEVQLLVFLVLLMALNLATTGAVVWWFIDQMGE